MIDFEKLKEQIMDASNGGLDIFYDLYPQANEKHNFKLRDEKTASASLKKAKGDGVWTITDFGGDNKSKNAITAYAEEKNLKYNQALTELAQQYGIPTAENTAPAKPTFKEYPLGNAPLMNEKKQGQKVLILKNQHLRKLTMLLFVVGNVML